MVSDHSRWLWFQGTQESYIYKGCYITPQPLSDKVASLVIGGITSYKVYVYVVRFPGTPCNPCLIKAGVRLVIGRVALELEVENAVNIAGLRARKNLRMGNLAPNRIKLPYTRVR